MTNTVFPSDPLQAEITTSFRSRLVATAGATFVDTNPDTAANDVNCKLSLDDPPPNFVTGAVFSQEVSQTLAQNTTTGVALAVTGRTAALAPGTYFVGFTASRTTPGRSSTAAI